MKNILAAALLTFSISPVAYASEFQVSNPTGTVSDNGHTQYILISNSSRDVIQLCNGYTDTDAALDKCIEDNMVSGVKIVLSELPGNSQFLRNRYLTNWDFCPLNLELDTRYSSVSNLCEI